MTMRLALASALTAVALAGCSAPRSDPYPDNPTPDTEVTAADSPVRLVGDAKASLVLYVSNQSFDDAEVRLTVTVDGVTVVDGDFPVESQHNWVRFPLAMSPGGHTITAASDSGATLRKSFDVDRGKTRYAVIDHWTDEERADLTWQFSRRPVAFA